MRMDSINNTRSLSIKEAVENPQKPERIPTGMGKSTVSNPAYLPTGFYSGDPEKFEFTRQQKANYDVIKLFLAKHGIRLDYIGAGKSPRGSVIFAATGPGVVWYKYEATSTASAVNVLYLNGNKISVGDFLRKSAAERDSLMKRDNAIHNFTQHQDFFRFVNALSAETNVADLNSFFATKGSEYFYNIITRNTVENPNRLTAIKKAELKLKQLGADTSWMNTNKLIATVIDEIVNRLLHKIKNTALPETANYLAKLPDQYRQNILESLYDKIESNEEAWVRDAFDQWMSTGALRSQWTTYSIINRNLAAVGYQPKTFTLANIVKGFSKDAILQTIDLHISAYRRNISSRSLAPGGLTTGFDHFDLMRVLSNLISSVPDESVLTIYLALNERRQELVDLARDGITAGYFDAYQKMTARHDVVLGWPELQPQNMKAVIDTEEFKQKTIRNMLVALREGRTDPVEKMIDNLTALGLDWNELKKIRAVIKRTAITESRDLNSMSEREQIATVKRNGSMIYYIKNPSLQVQLAAVSQDGSAIYHIRNPSEPVQLAAVQQNGWAIFYIKNPSEQVQLAAVNEIGRAIKYIQNPSEPVQLAAVKQNSYAIQYIRNPSLAVQLAAVKQNGFAIRYIQNPSPELLARSEVKHAVIRYLLVSIKSDYSIDDILDYLARHQVDWPELEKIRAVIKRTAITESRDLNSMSEREQIASVKRNGSMIYYIKNPSEQYQLAAVKQDGRAIEYIKNPSEPVQLAAVKQSGWVIKYIQNPSVEVQKAAVLKDIRTITHIQNPSPELFANTEVKHAVIRYLLVSIKSGHPIDDILDYLARHQVDWNELEKIRAAAKKKPITESHDLNSMSEREQIAAVEQDSYAIEYIKNPSLQVQLAAVEQVGYAIQYILNPSLEVQLAAVKQNGHAIYYIKNPGLQVQLAAVKESGWAIKYIDNPSVEVQIAAVKQSGYAIEYIQNPSLEVQLAAVKRDGKAIQYIQNPSPELFTNTEAKTVIVRALLVNIKSGRPIDDILDYLDRHQVDWNELKTIRLATTRKPVTESSGYDSMIEEEQIAAVKRNSNMIYYIKNPSEQVQLDAVKQSGLVLRLIRNPSEPVQLAAVKQNGNAIQYIQNPSLEVQLAAVKQDGRAIEYIKNPSEQVQLAAVEQDGYAIQHILKPSEQVQLASVKQSGWAIKYIQNPIVEVQKAAVLKDIRTITYIKNPSPELFANTEVKTRIIRALLFGIKSGHTIDDILDYLAIHQVDWPELEKIRSVAKKTAITESRDFNSMSEREQIAAVKQNGDAIEYIKNPSPELFADPEVKRAVIRRLLTMIKSGVYIKGFLEYLNKHQVDWPELKKIRAVMNRTPITESRDFNSMSEREQIEALKRDWRGVLIRYIQNSSLQVQLAVVQQNGYAIQYIQNPSLQVQLAAVKQNGYAITHIKNPSPELFTNTEAKTAIVRALLGGIKSDYSIDDILDYLDKQQVDWPELKKIRAVMNRTPITESRDFNSMSEREQIEALKRDWRGVLIRYIQNSSPDLFALLEVKHIVIRYLLSSIKSGYSIDGILDYLAEHRVYWPELDTIKKASVKTLMINKE